MELDKTSFFKLSNEQQEAIFLYATEKGHNWKENLASDWMRSAYNWSHPDKSYLLQEVRNQFGPDWKKDTCVPEAIKYEIHLPERFGAFQLYKLLDFYEVWEEGQKVISFDGPSEGANYESALAWMEQEIAPSRLEHYETTEYYESHSI